MKNIGYLNASRKADECYTPCYAVEPLLRYVQPNSTVWCPFDMEWSAYVQTLGTKCNVIHSHISEGKDFFNYEPTHYDYIISNPPYSCKDKVIARCYALGKPFALLLPLPTLQGIGRGKLFVEHGLQLLVFDGRVGYYTTNLEHAPKGNHFASAYFCWKFLPKGLMFEQLKYRDEALI